MSDRIFYPLAALIALAMICLSLVWPQGRGARSPGPFGHAVSPPGQPIAVRALAPVFPGPATRH